MRRINLALQGGGAHGAFTWGVLDTLLAQPDIEIEGISGTSAGALNAVALASGHARASAAGADPRVGARQALAALWEAVGQLGAAGSLQAQAARTLWGGLGAGWAEAWTQALAGVLSPEQANPLDINPLRELVRRQIDFEAIRRPGGPRVFVSATHVATGKAVLFTGARLTAEAVLASACLPTLFRAVEIDGQAYWDGGFSVNPAITPLIDGCTSEDIVVVQINPLTREQTPRGAREIRERMAELGFNASLLTQMRTIDLINRLLADGALAPGRCKPVRLHRIDGGAALAAYGAGSKLRPDPELIGELFTLGQHAAQRWLADHGAAIGQRGTVDVQRDYRDDTDLVIRPPAPGRSGGWLAGVRPWLARLLGRQRKG